MLPTWNNYPPTLGMGAPSCTLFPTVCLASVGLAFGHRSFEPELQNIMKISDATAAV